MTKEEMIEHDRKRLEEATELKEQAKKVSLEAKQKRQVEARERETAAAKNDEAGTAAAEIEAEGKRPHPWRKWKEPTKGKRNK